jgi:predicted ABC-type ATPase
MQGERAKDAIVIGGANGAGKTSWATDQLPSTLQLREFVNADEIAQGFFPLDPEGNALAAGRLMIERLRALVQAGESFAFETTCAGRGHARFLETCRAAGYRTTLVFLWLPSVDIALARVAQRVREGGHGIPNDVIVRRYSLGLRNMRQIYLPLADIALIYDNSDRQGVLVASRELGAPLIVHDSTRWSKIEEASR